MGHATTVKLTDAATAARLLRFIDRDATWLFDLQVERGLEWLQLQFGAGSVRERLAESRLFWAWWTNQWAVRDARLNACLSVSQEALLQYKVNGFLAAVFLDSDDFRPLFLAHHRPSKLNIHLDGDVLNSILRRLDKAA